MLVGGPWGAAIGAAIGLIVGLKENTISAAESQNRMQESFDKVAGALNALQKPTKQRLADLRAQTREALKAAQAELQLAMAQRQTSLERINSSVHGIDSSSGSLDPVGDAGVRIDEARKAIVLLKEQEKQVERLLANAGDDVTPSPVSFGGGSGSGKRDRLAELVDGMRAAREAQETLVHSASGVFETMHSDVETAVEVVNKLNDAGLNLSERFTNGFSGATEQVLAWMGVLDEAGIAVGQLTEKEAALGEQLAQEAKWLADLTLQYDNLMEKREQDAELREKFAELEEELADGNAFESDFIERQLERAQEWYDERLALLEENRNRELVTDAAFLKQKEALEEQYANRVTQLEQKRYATMASSAASAFGSIASATRQFAGEQSGIYKAMFAVSKAFAIAESIIKIQQAMAEAIAQPFPANLAAIATVAAQGASIISTISSVVASFSGGGIVHGPGGPRSDSIPARLSDGEFVVNAAATQQNRPLLEAVNAGSSGRDLMGLMGLDSPRFVTPPTAANAPMSAASGDISVQVKVANESGYPVRAASDPTDPGRIRIIADQAVREGAGNAVADDLVLEESRVSRAITENTTAQRRR